MSEAAETTASSYPKDDTRRNVYRKRRNRSPDNVRTIELSEKRGSEFVSPSLLARAIREGWQINPKRKRAYFRALDNAIKDLDKIEDPAKRSMIAARINDCLIAEQGQAIHDVQHIEKMQHETGILDLRARRAEEGKPNDCIALVAPVKELPLPEALREMRAKLLEPSDS